MLNTRNTNLILRWRIYPSKTLVVSREGSGIRIILDSSESLLIKTQIYKTFIIHPDTGIMPAIVI